MTWCTHCGEDCETARDPDKGYVCCVECGKILDQDIYYDGPTFEKTGGGQTRMAGSILHSVQSGYSVSRERTLMRGRDEIGAILNYLNMGGGESMINKAHAFYQIAVDKNFTRGRRTSHVAASCLYIACRQMEKAYLLIDFTDYLQTNVYVLGAVFLQLCKMLSLNDHPIIQKLVDPSLFIHRFTERLLSQNNGPVSYFRKREIIEVSETALHIVASMKRDWMQTGRKPSGLCGAALYISALSHGHNFSRSDIDSDRFQCLGDYLQKLGKGQFDRSDSNDHGNFDKPDIPSVRGSLKMLGKFVDHVSGDSKTPQVLNRKYSEVVLAKHELWNNYVRLEKERDEVVAERDRVQSERDELMEKLRWEQSTSTKEESFRL